MHWAAWKALCSCRGTGQREYDNAHEGGSPRMLSWKKPKSHFVPLMRAWVLNWLLELSSLTLISRVGEFCYRSQIQWSKVVIHPSLPFMVCGFRLWRALILGFLKNNFFPLATFFFALLNHSYPWRLQNLQDHPQVSCFALVQCSWGSCSHSPTGLQTFAGQHYFFVLLLQSGCSHSKGVEQVSCSKSNQVKAFSLTLCLICL